ncbi:hypothetical protein HAX54_043188 [Datura stramonium]|uniref:Pentatricopeptide repeat-containing protein n=1 Tax=Datura stramonium TaxID=4076 RepID=A0ABS8W0L7_DATST|nr:hypothetical protein [Datura stramonium]
MDSVLIVRLMMEHSLVPEVRTLSTVLNGLIRVRRFDLVLQLFDKAVNWGVKPDEYIYTAVLKSFERISKLSTLVDEMGLFLVPREAVVSRMLDNKVELTIYPYNSLVNGYCKAGKCSAAESIFNEMIDKGLDSQLLCKPISLIDGYCKKEIHSAFRLYHEMTGKEFTITTTALISGFCRARMMGIADGNTVRALKLLDEMKKGLIPDTYTYRSLITGLCASAQYSA